MLIYYVTPYEKKLFEIDKKGVKELSLRDLKNPLNLFKKKILILGKEWTYFIKKRYPLLSEKELIKALSHEVPDLFSLKNPSWVYSISKKGETFIEVSIFAWEKALAEELKKEFPFGYLIPEELLFSSKEPALFLIKRNEKILLVASEKGQFLNSFFGKAPLTFQDLILFLKSLGEREEKIKKVIAYRIPQEEVLKILPDRLKPYLSVKEDVIKDLSHYIGLLNLKKFRTKEPIKINLEDLMLKTARIFLMGVIALQVNLMLSYWEYSKAISKLKEEIKKLEAQSREILPAKKTSSFSQDEEKIKALRELEDEFNRLKGDIASYPLQILDELSRLLPDGSRLERFSLKEKKLELSVSAKDLFEVLSTLRKSSLFSDVKLASSPMLNSRTKEYSFRLEIELK